MLMTTRTRPRFVTVALSYDNTSIKALAASSKCYTVFYFMIPVSYGCIIPYDGSTEGRGTGSTTVGEGRAALD